MPLLKEYFHYILNHKPMPNDKALLFALIRDMTDRRGLRHEWDKIDDDVREELLNTWLSIIRKFTGGVSQ